MRASNVGRLDEGPKLGLLVGTRQAHARGRATTSVLRETASTYRTQLETWLRPEWLWGTLSRGVAAASGSGLVPLSSGRAPEPLSHPVPGGRQSPTPKQVCSATGLLRSWHAPCPLRASFPWVLWLPEGLCSGCRRGCPSLPAPWPGSRELLAVRLGWHSWGPVSRGVALLAPLSRVQALGRDGSVPEIWEVSGSALAGPCGRSSRPGSGSEPRGFPLWG